MPVFFGPKYLLLIQPTAHCTLHKSQTISFIVNIAKLLYIREYCRLQTEEQKSAKARTTFQKVKYFQKLAHYVPSNAKSNHMVQIHGNLEGYVKFVDCS